MSPEALPEAAPGRKGVFVAVVGPSGAGKDTVLKAAAGMLQAEAGVHFVRRVVTRAADAACEDHATLSPDDFIAARESGAFCLSWGAHGLFYGLPASIGDRLADGQTVVANLSRTALADAARRFGGIHPESYSEPTPTAPMPPRPASPAASRSTFATLPTIICASTIPARCSRPWMPSSPIFCRFR